MFGKVIAHEIRLGLKRPIFYILLLGFSGLAFIAFIANSGALDEVAFNGRIINSSFEVHYLVQYFNKFFMFLLPVIVGGIVFRDFRYNVHSILFSYPLQRNKYIGAKLLSAFFLTLAIVLTVYLAFIFAEQLSIYPAGSKALFSLNSYGSAFFMYTLPNILLYGTFVFFTVLLTRNIYAGFILVIVLFFIQNITQNVFDGHGFFIALFDPLASNAYEYLTSEWNLKQRNTQSIPIKGVVLWNRLFWSFVVLLFSTYAWIKFQFHQQAPLFQGRFLSLYNTPQNTERKRVVQQKIQFNYGPKAIWESIWIVSQFHLGYIIKGKMFQVILLLGIFAVVFAVGRVTNSGEITVLPITNIVLTIPAFFFSTIIMLLTFIYSGMLVFRERSCGVHFLIDTTGLPLVSRFMGKVLAILKMQLVLLLVMLVAGVLIQLYNGYFNLELPLYVLNLFVIQYITLVIWAFVSVAIHIFTDSLYLGIFVLLLGWLGTSGLAQMGITSNLLLFNFSEPLLYSDISGFNGVLVPYFLVKLFWFLISLVALCLCFLFYRRGFTFTFGERIKIAFQRFGRPVRILFVLLGLGVFLTGLTIFFEESKREFSVEEEERLFQEFEANFEKYGSIKGQPSITHIELDVQLFPKDQRMIIDGNYLIQNNTEHPIDTLLVKNGFNETSTLVIKRPHKVIDRDEYVDFWVYVLEKPLQPKDVMELEFSLGNAPISIFQNTSKVLKNGTFIRNNIFPRFGYFLDGDMDVPEGALSTGNSYHGQGADLVHVKTTIGTDVDQIAVAPGQLKKTWIDNGRRYFTFETVDVIRNSLSFHSGEYEQKRFFEDNMWLDIFYGKEHSFNLEDMKDGFYAAVNFNTEHFGTPIHQNFSIVEFPMTQGTFATLIGNIIPTSEMRFIANSKISEGKINLAFYVIAHETTHHWFGELLSPANAKGATILTESITEYLSLRIYEQRFGVQSALRFLRKQHQRYWEGSVREDMEEPPLMIALPEQQYLTYGKGTIAFNTLGYKWGHDNLLCALKEFFECYKGNNYPTSTALIEHLEERVPYHLRYILNDYFKTNTRHTIKTFEVEQRSHGADFEIAVQLKVSQRRRGSNEAVPVPNGLVEIGFYDENGRLIALEPLQNCDVPKLGQIFTFPQKVSKVLLDPNKLLLLKDDDTMSVFL
ncbi:MAG: M1 family aminopeptidase [Bacteroidota bacterium]